MQYIFLCRYLLFICDDLKTELFTNCFRSQNLRNFPLSIDIYYIELFSAFSDPYVRIDLNTINGDINIDSVLTKTKKKVREIHVSIMLVENKSIDLMNMYVIRMNVVEMWANINGDDVELHWISGRS